MKHREHEPGALASPNPDGSYGPARQADGAVRQDLPCRGLRSGAVIVLWVAMSFLNVLYVALFTQNLPFVDDYGPLPWLLGESTLSWQYLWAPVQEHRMVPTRLAIWLLALAGGADFRIHFLVNSLLLSLASLTVLSALRHARGRTTFADLIVPVFCMSWIHWWNLRQIVGLTFALYLLLLMTLLAAVLRTFWKSTGWTALVCGILLFLPHLASMGLLLSAAFVPYAIACGRALLRGSASGDRRRAALLTGSACGAALTIGLYLATTPSTRENLPANPLRWEVASTFLKSASMALGPGVNAAWQSAEAGMAGLTALALVVMVLACAGRKSSGAESRLQGLGLLALLAGTLLILAAIGISRADRGGHAGLSPWYATLAAPIPVLGLAGIDGDRRGWVRRALVGALIIAAGFTLVSSTISGWRNGWNLREAAGRMMQDRRAGYPGQVVAQRYDDYFCMPSAAALWAGLDLLEKHGKGPFRPGGGEVLLPLPYLEFRALDLGGWKGKGSSIRPIGAGSARGLGRAVLLEVGSAEDAFRLSKAEFYGRGGLLVRMDLLSGGASTARLSGRRSAERGAGNEVIAEADIFAGANTLMFFFDAADLSDREWVLTPGAVGTYRINGISFLELPAKGGPAQRRYTLDGGFDPF